MTTATSELIDDNDDWCRTHPSIFDNNSTIDPTFLQEWDDFYKEFLPFIHSTGALTLSTTENTTAPLPAGPVAAISNPPAATDPEYHTFLQELDALHNELTLLLSPNHVSMTATTFAADDDDRHQPLPPPALSEAFLPLPVSYSYHPMMVPMTPATFEDEASNWPWSNSSPTFLDKITTKIAPITPKPMPETNAINDDDGDTVQTQTTPQSPPNAELSMMTLDQHSDDDHMFLQQWNEFYLEFVHSNKFYNDQSTSETVAIDNDANNATVQTQQAPQSPPNAELSMMTPILPLADDHMFLQQWNTFHLEFTHSNNFYNDKPTTDTIAIDDDDGTTGQTQHTLQLSKNKLSFICYL